MTRRWLAVLALAGANISCGEGSKSTEVGSSALPAETTALEFPGCDLRVFTSPERIAPIAWRPCTFAPADIRARCRQIAVDWNPPPGHDAIAAGAATLPDGSVVLATTRHTRHGLVALVVEADGPVRAAILSPVPDRCVAAPSGLGPVSAEHYAFEVAERGAAVGAVGGNHSEPVPRWRQRFAGTGHGFVVGDHAVLHVAEGRLELLGWRRGDLVDVPRTEGPASFPHFAGRTLLWNEARAGRTRIGVRGDGVPAPLLQPERDVFDAGSDGSAWVWNERTAEGGAELHALGDGLHRRLMTSSPLAGLPTVVGAGWAARLEVEAGSVRGVRAVRIRDGATVWLGSTADFRFAKPLAIARDEIFVLVGERGTAGVARVRLDLLADAPNPG